MAGRLEYKILKNMPEYNAYGQYYYNESDNLDFLDGSGIATTIKTDDLYTRVIEEGYINADDTTGLPDFRPITEILIGNPTVIDNANNVLSDLFIIFVP